MIARGDDIDRIMAVMNAAFDPAFGEAWSRRQVEDALLVGNCHYGLIASSGDAPQVGEPAAGFFLSRHGVEEEELLLLGVDPAERRRGLGAKLLERFFATARARGARRLLLEMRRGNPAEALYLNFGFVPVGERRMYYRAPGGERFDAVTFTCKCE
jgi:[ribosomal protein S18]-alanine N-acetyltransferase